MNLLFLFLDGIGLGEDDPETLGVVAWMSSSASIRLSVFQNSSMTNSNR